MRGEIDFHGTPAVRLQAQDGSEAVVVPGIGANCVALRVPHPNGNGPAHLLSTPPSAAALLAHGTGSGFPILWPHPGMNRAPFTWKGRTYEPPGVAGRLAGHGFLAAAPWQVVDVYVAGLVSRLDTRALDPATAWWPWPFTVTATHRLTAGTLTLTLDFANLGDEVVPMMCGLHPYFPLRFIPQATGDGGAAGPRPRSQPLPLPTAADLVGADEAGARETCRVWVEADTLWDLAQGRATGNTRPVGEHWDVHRPRSLAALARTAAVAGVAQPNGRMPVLLYGTPAALSGARLDEDPAGPGGITSGVVDDAAGLKMTFETSRAFGTVALYTPAGHPAVSLEPRSALPDALTLAAADPDTATGLRAVEPGATWRAWARLSLVPV